MPAARPESRSMNAPVLSDAEFVQLRDWVHAQAGISMSSAKKPPTQVFRVTCMSKKSAFEIGHEMVLDP